MVVNAEQRWLRDQLHAGLFSNLANNRVAQVFSGLNASCGNLCPRFRMISVLEHQEVDSAFDVDHDSLMALHSQIVSPVADDAIVTWASVRKLCPERARRAWRDRRFRCRPVPEIRESGVRESFQRNSVDIGQIASSTPNSIEVQIGLLGKGVVEIAVLE
ncbi:MAG: hypothetical protein WKF41_09270 [Gaiellaceae bacterium]